MFLYSRQMPLYLRMYMYKGFCQIFDYLHYSIIIITSHFLIISQLLKVQVLEGILNFFLKLQEFFPDRYFIIKSFMQLK